MKKDTVLRFRASDKLKTSLKSFCEHSGETLTQFMGRAIEDKLKTSNIELFELNLTTKRHKNLKNLTNVRTFSTIARIVGLYEASVLYEFARLEFLTIKDINYNTYEAEPELYQQNDNICVSFGTTEIDLSLKTRLTPFQVRQTLEKLEKSELISIYYNDLTPTEQYHIGINHEDLYNLLIAEL